MAENSDPNLIFEQKYGPYRLVKVFKNRLVISERGMFFTGKEETILFRNIASVELRGVLQKIRIRTTDGKIFERDWLLGSTAQAIQKAINENI